MCVHSAVSDSLGPHGLQLARLLCPWNFPGKNTGGGCNFLLQGIFTTQGSNPCLLHLLRWQADSLPLHHLGNPVNPLVGVMTNLDSILKSRDITLPTKAHLVRAMVFPLVMYGCESWTVKKAEHRRTDAFELWCWRRFLRVPWTARRSN